MAYCRLKNSFSAYLLIYDNSGFTLYGESSKL